MSLHVSPSSAAFLRALEDAKLKIQREKARAEAAEAAIRREVGRKALHALMNRPTVPSPSLSSLPQATPPTSPARFPPAVTTPASPLSASLLGMSHSIGTPGGPDDRLFVSPSEGYGSTFQPRVPPSPHRPSASGITSPHDHPPSRPAPSVASAWDRTAGQVTPTRNHALLPRSPPPLDGVGSPGRSPPALASPHSHSAALIARLAAVKASLVTPRSPGFTHTLSGGRVATTTDEAPQSSSPSLGGSMMSPHARSIAEHTSQAAHAANAAARTAVHVAQHTSLDADSGTPLSPARSAVVLAGVAAAQAQRAAEEVRQAVTSPPGSTLRASTSGGNEQLPPSPEGAHADDDSPAAAAASRSPKPQHRPTASEREEATLSLADIYARRERERRDSHTKITQASASNGGAQFGGAVPVRSRPPASTPVDASPAPPQPSARSASPPRAPASVPKAQKSLVMIIGADEGAGEAAVHSSRVRESSRPRRSDAAAGSDTTASHGATIRSRVGTASNKARILNALQTVALAGTHRRAELDAALAALSAADSASYLILLAAPDALSYRGLYSFDQAGGRTVRIHGSGPADLTAVVLASKSEGAPDPDFVLTGAFKYSTGQRRFEQLPSTVVGLTTDAISIKAKKLK